VSRAVWTVGSQGLAKPAKVRSALAGFISSLEAEGA
jgi:hypothetical protein